MVGMAVGTTPGTAVGDGVGTVLIMAVGDGAILTMVTGGMVLISVKPILPTITITFTPTAHTTTAIARQTQITQTADARAFRAEPALRRVVMPEAVARVLRVG